MRTAMPMSSTALPPLPALSPLHALSPVFAALVLTLAPACGDDNAAAPATETASSDGGDNTDAAAIETAGTTTGTDAETDVDDRTDRPDTTGDDDDADDDSATTGGATDTTGPADTGNEMGTDTDPDTDTDSGDTTDTGTQDLTGVVETAQGLERGQRDDNGIWSYLGIRYVAAPTGANRWRAPQPAPAFAGIHDAKDKGPACPQTASLITGQTPIIDEDCLHLNIWTPEPTPGTPTGKRAVLFWIHGGGNIQGSGGEATYDGASLASKDVVVVTFNYRLGALGYMAHDALVDQDPQNPGAGNYGTLDIIAALKWVSAHIAAFGGDPDRVLVFGESAGGINTCVLMASPLAAGLFHRAGIESAACINAPYLAPPAGVSKPLAQGDRLVKKFGCDTAPDVAACLRGLPYTDILDKQDASLGILGIGGSENYGPIVDGHALTETPAAAMRNGQVAPVPLMMGYNRDEGRLFALMLPALTTQQYATFVDTAFGATVGAQVVAHYPLADYNDNPREAIAQIITDTSFVCQTKGAAGAHAANGHDAYSYLFSYVPPTNLIPTKAGFALGACHGVELPYVFNTGPAAKSTNPQVRTLIDAMQTYWTEFAKTGAMPNSPITWPKYDGTADEVLEFKIGGLGAATAFRAADCAFWKSVSVAP